MAQPNGLLTMDTIVFTILLTFCIYNSIGVAQKFDADIAEMADSGTDRLDDTYGPQSVFLHPLKGFGNDAHTNNSGPSKGSKVEVLSKTFKSSVQRIKHKQKKMDIVFLIDSSSSVGKNNFHSELKFVKKFLSDFNVSFNYTRVAVVTFSSKGKIVRHVDHISKGNEMNDKCRLLNYEMPKISFTGGGTYTAGALKEARNILTNGRRHSKKLVCLITDGFSNGLDPVPVAQKLKNDNITIITIGIQTGNSAELYNISSSPGEDHSFLLDSFAHFESLARKALHSDYKLGTSLRIKDLNLCDILCDKPGTSGNQTTSCCDVNAECSCSTTSGHYSCVCNPGYYGEGMIDKCQLCPNGTYWQNWNLCKPCPDVNHVTMEMPALNITYCQCKAGFKAHGDNQCEILTCPVLDPPEHGYFVKHPTGCGHVLNAACGARCKSGYQLIGSSIRLCQENGTWSGSEAKCVLKTCPKLTIPFYGMVVCKNSDLNLHFDYTPRNNSFMDFYDRDDLRVTEPMPFDTDCSFKCGPGFYMVGSTKRNCLPLSKWDGLQTACKQILCSPLTEVSFSEYDPTDCTEQKMAYGTNCTLICKPGFEAKGPAVKTCNGKRTGVWTNRNKYPKCVDITPPELSCPANFSISMSADDDFAIVKLFPQPNVTDNSDANVTYWIKPAVKSEGVKLTLGNHTFTYTAVDAFKNKAKCNFTVSVLDTSPPVLDNCIDPPEIKIPLAPLADQNLSFVDWDPPIIYDNSNTALDVIQSLQPGFLGVGTHRVIYNATDPSGNHNSCIMNVTVKATQCDVLTSPPNGQSICARNLTHTWCEVTCDVGYAIFDELAENHLENFKLFCENKFAKWPYDTLPDCTQLELPEAIEQVFSFTLDSEEPICNDNSLTTDELQNEMRAQMREQLCTGIEVCEIASELPDCSEVSNTEVSTIRNDLSEKTYYNIVKREVPTKRNNTKTGPNMKIRVYTRISKKLGLWDQKLPRSENIKKVKAELRTFHTNPALRKKLESLRINIRHMNLDELTLCRNGSVSKKSACVQCPRGSYHNVALNICQLCSLGYYNNRTGRTECFSCPEHFSTRKLGSKSSLDCIEQCPPGTIAKVKMRANQKLQNSLMPFCRKCQPGQYQAGYNQIKCDSCPKNNVSPRGSVSGIACYPKQSHPCFSHPSICGPSGVCQQENENAYLYSCLCQEEFIGSHCEVQIDLCASAPCQNGGTCNQLNSTSIECKCSVQFRGDQCENGIDSCSTDICRNGGTCIDSDGKPICECAAGYEGEFCEIQHNFCSMNPCESGKCLNTPEGYMCQCPPGIIGRRCHLRPCDYLPCHKHSNCLDLQVFPASRNSFVCRCPAGLKGFDCSQLDSPCDAEPCRNNGVCVPTALRNSTNRRYVVDEKMFEKFTCNCPPYFYGSMCETLTTPDFVIEFSKSGIHNYVEVKGPTDNLKEISLCTWLQTNDSFNYGTILSYASDSSDNMFTVTDYNGFVLYVNGNNIITDIQINDGQWHFICISWSSENGIYEIYVDGSMRDTGFNLSPGSYIEANGTMIIGQEQDSLGTSFSETESFVGRIAYLDVWKRFITFDEMLDYYTTCEPYQGDLYSWTDFKSKIKGNVKITTSPFCKPCNHNLRLLNGFIRYMGSSAFHFCYDGYRLQGTSRRDCLRTSQWSQPVPFCQSIHCGHLPSLANGIITIEKTASGEEASFSCNENYYLVGPKSRICLTNGTWSGDDPECISDIECDRISTSPNSHLIYANEKGTISGDKLKYPMGTFIEIQCINDKMLLGENFLSCTESGTWDYPAPQCVAEDDYQQQIIVETTTIKREWKAMPSRPSITSMTLTSKIVQPSPNKTAVNDAPDKDYWLNLRRFFYYGCSISGDQQSKKSEFCNQLTGTSNNFTDLTDFESPDSDDFKNMDLRLVTYLKKAAGLLANSTNAEKLNFENLFNLIIYGNLSQSDGSALLTAHQSSSVENSFRLVLCFYIDTILLDSDLHISTATDGSKKLENITQSIKAYLLEIVSVAYRNFKSLQRSKTETSLLEMTTKAYVEKQTKGLVRVSRSTPSFHQDDLDEYDSYSDLDLLHEDVTYDYEDLLITSSAMEPTSTTIIETSSIVTTMADPTSTTTEGPGYEASSTYSSVEIDLTTHTSYATSEQTGTFDENDLFSSTNIPFETTALFIDGCSLTNLPKFPKNSVVVNISRNDVQITLDIASIRTITATVEIETKVVFGCDIGHILIGDRYTICEANLIWRKLNMTCKPINCGAPMKPNEMTMNQADTPNNFLLGHKLTLRCNKGFNLIGNPFIFCLANGKWSTVMSHCSKLSCPKPSLNVMPTKPFYLYDDKVQVTCSDNSTAQIICESNGNWSPKEDEICLGK